MDLHIYLPYANSLKEKRQIRLSLVERLRGHFKLSIAEVGSQDVWQRLELALAYVAINQTAAEEMRDKIIVQTESILAGEAELLQWESDIV